jgi:nitronate monooxygenase
MPLPKILQDNLAIPVIGSPLFLVSGPELVIAQCKAGIVGSFPRIKCQTPTCARRLVDKN